MKIMKLFSVIALSAMTLSLAAATTNRAFITVAPTEGDANDNDVVKIWQDPAVETNFASNENAPKTTSDEGTLIWAVGNGAALAAVVNPEIDGIAIVIRPNGVDTKYTLSFSNVLGTVKLYDAVEDEVITMASGNSYPFELEDATATVADRFILGEPAANIHHRAVAAGSFGTICFPNKITAMEGVKDGKLLEFVTNGGTFVEAQEVELANMEVGKAYIFEASADAQSFTYNPESSVASPVANNGLVGTFEEEGISIEADAWIIKGSAIKAVLAGSPVPQYRAYIPSLDDIHTIQASAPVRRFLVGEATGLQEIKAMEGTRKAIVNGRLVIIREGRMFNALGGRK